MDLVKIGFQINANGLKEANTEVDKLLNKVDNIGTKGKKASSDFESSQKKVQDSVKKTEKVSTSASDKMIQKQQTINQLLPYMDKNTANLASSFWLVSKEAQSFNKYLDLLENNKAITQQKKQVEGLAKEQAKAATSAEAEKQKRLLAEQNYYQKVQEQARKTTAKELENLQKAEASAESLRQKKLLSEQNYYLRVQEESKKASAKEQESLKKREAEQEDLRQKRLLSEQNYYLKTQEEAKKAVAKEEALQQKAIDDAEKARQQSLSRIQNDYIKQQESVAKAQQSAIDKQVKAQNALNESNQKAITLEQAKAKYVAQGYGKTDSTRLARLEVSGADVTTLNNYKSAIEATTKATQALNPAVEKASVNHNKFLDSVKGIAVYAALSAAIYGVMTAMTTLAVSTVKMADEYTAIQNRMKLYIKDAVTLVEVNQKLANSSMENNVGLRETATLFARLAPPMQRLGRSTEDITTVVDAFGKSMRIGGATAMEAASATIQFSQAMASGKLAGDEFRSISEASPRFLQAIAEGSGIAAAKLKEMSAAGLLTTKVITEALIKSYGKLSDENSRLGITLEQGANAVKTAFTVAIGEFNEGAGITRFFGESLMDLAISFKELSSSAKANGEAFNQWISDNEKNIALLGKTATLVASIMVGKLVASFTAVMLAAIKVRVQTLALNASLLLMGNTARSATGLMNGLAVAISRISFAGWLGVAATVASVVVGFKAFQESTSEATTELVSHNKYVAMTTEELKALGVVQRDLAKFKLNMDLSEAEKNISSAKDEMVKALDEVIYKWDFIKKSGDNGFVKQYDAIIASVKSGKTSYDQAIKQLSELGAVTPETAKELSKTAGEYDKTVDAMLPFVKVLDTIGVKHKITKDATANGRTENELYKRGLDELKSSAIDVGDALGGLAGKYKLAAEVLAGGIQVGKITGIKDKGIAEELYKDVDDVVKNLEGRLIFKNPKGITAQSLIESGMFDESIERARELLKLQKQSSDFFQEDKSGEALRKYQDQVDTVNRIQQLLAKGVDYEVAKVAASKEYFENIQGTEVAQQVVLARQIQQRLEYLATLSEEEDIQTRAILLQQKGASYVQSRAIAEAGFRDDAEGLLALQKLMTNELYAQHYSLDEQLSWYTSINKMLKDGVGLEEATTRATFSRLEATKKGLSDSEKSLMKVMLAQQKSLKDKETERQVTLTLNNAEKQRVAYVNAQAGGYANLIKNMAIANKIASDPTLSPDQAKKLVEAEELTNYEKELAELKRQTYIATLDESDAVKALVSNYSTMDSVQIGVLANQQRLLEIAKELAEEAEKQKNPLGDFSNVDFSVFGDFGNPFQSALDGMNKLIRTTAEGGETIKKLNEEIEAAKLKGLDVTQQEFNLNLEVQKQAKDKKQSTDQAITSALSLTKSLFKEESKGYKIMSGLEKAYQAKKIAFALWEKKDTIAMLALSLKAHITDTLGFTTGAAAKLAAQGAVNVAKGTEAVLTQGTGDPYTAFARMAAMVAVVAGLGVAIASIAGGSSGGFAPTNEGTGTVFGGAEDDKSESIVKAMELLADNSELGLPISSAMLRSLQNIEGSIGGLTNLVVRNGVGSELASGVKTGFSQDFIGKSIASGYDAVNKMTFGLADTLTLGLFSSVGKFVSSLFGKKTSIKGQGLAGFDQSMQEVLTGGFDLKEYVDVETKKKTFGITTSKKRSTNYSEASDELSKQFTLILTNMHESIKGAAPLLTNNLGAVEKALNDYVVNIGRIDLKGLSGEEIQERLSAVFSAEADKMAQAAFGYLEDFQQVGEGYFETLVRVAAGVEEAQYYTERLNVATVSYAELANKQGNVAAEIVRQSILVAEGNKRVVNGFYDLVDSFTGTAGELVDFVGTLRDLQDAIYATGKSGDYLTSTMILGAGGANALEAGLEAYFELLSPAEQVAEMTRRLTNEFAIFGEQLPSDVEAFKDLVNGIDITTKAGQKLYGQVLALTPEFSDLQDALDDVNKEVNGLVKSLRDLADEARRAAGETNQPQNLEVLRNQFNSEALLAMQGDAAASERLLTLGQSLMKTSKQYSVNGSDYARDLAMIQRAATVSADMQEAGLGYTPPTLNSMSGSSGTSIETTNSATDAKLDALREDMITAITAVAKYTQDTANRLERWDYGDRVSVRVDQDALDKPIPVKVV